MSAGLTPVAGPFLKWVGGKRQLLPTIAAHVPPTFGRYHEPLVGAGALFFHLRSRGFASGATLSDSNERLIRTWRGVRDSVGEVIDQLRTLKEEHSPTRYYEVRSIPIDGGTDADVAAWFIYLNRTCVNGLYRVNASGQFNASLGDYANPRICDEPGLRAASAALQGIDLRIEDFGGVRRAKPGDFVYLDPPYHPLTVSASFSGYTASGFGWEEQVRLRDVARSLKARGVHVLASNSSAPAVHELYSGFEIAPVPARRAVSCKVGGRGPVTELLIT